MTSNSDKESYKNILNEMNLTPPETVDSEDAVKRVLEQVDLELEIGFYILKGKIPMRVPLMEWAMWFEENFENRIVDKTMVGKVRVSTVFLGLDHGFTSGGELILFETMTFDFEEDIQMRYPTWEIAQEGHNKIVHYVKNFKRKG